MKKTYIFILLAIAFTVGFSQSTIVTIDRPNGSEPTATGNDPTITSVGLTRGSGIQQRNATDFTSRR
jgi:hypothetical protein